MMRLNHVYVYNRYYFSRIFHGHMDFASPIVLATIRVNKLLFNCCKCNTTQAFIVGEEKDYGRRALTPFFPGSILLTVLIPEEPTGEVPPLGVRGFHTQHNPMAAAPILYCLRFLLSL